MASPRPLPSPVASRVRARSARAPPRARPRECPAPSRSRAAPAARSRIRPARVRPTACSGSRCRAGCSAHRRSARAAPATHTGRSGAASSSSIARADACSMWVAPTSCASATRSMRRRSRSARASGSSAPKLSSCCTSRPERWIEPPSSSTMRRIACGSGASVARARPSCRPVSEVRSWCAAVAANCRSRASMVRMRASSSLCELAKACSSRGTSSTPIGSSEACERSFQRVAMACSGRTVRRTAIAMASRGGHHERDDGPQQHPELLLGAMALGQGLAHQHRDRRGAGARQLHAHHAHRLAQVGGIEGFAAAVVHARGAAVGQAGLPGQQPAGLRDAEPVLVDLVEQQHGLELRRHVDRRDAPVVVAQQRDARARGIEQPAVEHALDDLVRVVEAEAAGHGHHRDQRQHQAQQQLAPQPADAARRLRRQGFHQACGAPGAAVSSTSM